MRYLTFDVNAQKLIPTSDNSNIVRGTKDYLNVRVNFIGTEWDNCKVVACFVSGIYKDYAPIVDGCCKVPNEAASKRAFKMNLIGRNETYEIKTNQIVISQKE